MALHGQFFERTQFEPLQYKSRLFFENGRFHYCAPLLTNVYSNVKLGDSPVWALP